MVPIMFEANISYVPHIELPLQTSGKAIDCSTSNAMWPYETKVCDFET